MCKSQKTILNAIFDDDDERGDDVNARQRKMKN